MPHSHTSGHALAFTPSHLPNAPTQVLFTLYAVNSLSSTPRHHHAITGIARRKTRGAHQRLKSDDEDDYEDGDDSGSESDDDDDDSRQGGSGQGMGRKASGRGLQTVSGPRRALLADHRGVSSVTV